VNRPVASELSRELSIFQITMLGVGMMIGAGVFVTTGIGIGAAGPGGILMAFSLNGLLALLSVMTYAELASAMPHAGAGYSYVQQSIGGFAGFFSGWISWFAHTVAGSLYAITFSKYLLHFLSQLDLFAWLNTNLSLFEKVLAVLTALVFIYVNYRGASETGTAGAAIATGQTVVLGVIGVAGVIVAMMHPGRMENFQPFLPAGWGKILVVMGFSLVGYEGYEVIANTAEEAIDAKSNVPRGMFYATMIVITTYLFVAFAAIVGVKASGMSVTEWFEVRGATGFGEAITHLLPLGGLLVTLAAVFASTSALNATIYSSTRICFALGRDGYLPRAFSHISRKTRTPRIALFMSGAITVFIAATLPVEVVCAGASLFFIVLFSLVAVAAIKARKEQGHVLSYGYLMPFFPLIPVVSFAGQLLIGVFLLDMGVSAYVIAVAWVGIGVFLYSFYSKSRATEGREQRVPVPERTEAPSAGCQVMVPVANPQTASLLVRYANLIATGKGAEVVITSVVTVPYATPLEEADAFVGDARDLVGRTSRLVASGLPVHSVVRYGHNISRAIIGSVRERKTDFLVLGWRGYSRREHHAMGSTLDPVIRRAPCDIVVVKADEEDPEREIKRILCPIRGKSAHRHLAIQVVRLISETYDAEVTILHVLPRRKSESYAVTMTELAPRQRETPPCSVKIIKSDDLVTSIVEESRKHDMVVIGATEASMFRQLLFGSVPEAIAKRCPRTVLMVKKRAGLGFRFGRWLGRARAPWKRA